MIPDPRSGSEPVSDVTVRRAGEEDLADLRALCRRSILGMGPSGYDSPQVEAWAAFTDDEDAFTAFVLGNRTWVALRGGVPVGFAGLGEDGYVASLYVDPGFARRGIASALLRHLLETGRREGVVRFHAAASTVSLPVFRRFGFRVVTEEWVDRGGVSLLRYRVALGDGYP
jgi:putative acetyltransferase